MTFSLDDEWHGLLTAEVEAGGFAGQGSAWFSTLQIRTFMLTCQAFPLAAEDPPTLEGGLYSTVHPGQLDQVLVGLRVTPFDRRGRLLVRTSLASGGATDQELQQSVTTRFVTEHAKLDDFCRELGQLLHDGGGQALLAST